MAREMRARSRVVTINSVVQQKQLRTFYLNFSHQRSTVRMNSTDAALCQALRRRSRAALR